MAKMIFFVSLGGVLLAAGIVGVLALWYVQPSADIRTMVACASTSLMFLILGLSVIVGYLVDENSNRG